MDQASRAPSEIELKLEADPAAFVDAELFAAEPGRVERLVSTYFDTPGHELAAAGYSLRIRTGGDGAVQTVKAGATTAGLFVRPEWEAPVEGDTPRLDAAASPIAQFVADDVLARVAPVFTTEVTRTVQAVAIEDAEIELALDEGVVRAGERTAQLCEVELELKSGAPRALFDLARRLDEQAPLRLGVRTKAERGYALTAGEDIARAKAEPVSLDPAATAVEGFAAIAHACIRQFRLNETILLRTGGVEALHQARVGLRRLRSAFSLFRALFDGDDRATMLRAELKWLAAELGEVRNLDVLIPRFEGATRAALEAARARTFEHVHVQLASARTRLLMVDLVEWLALGAWRTAPADPELAARALPAFAADVLDAHARRLKKRGRGLAELDDHDRHQVRIEAKKLRYAAEFFAALFTARKRGARRHKAFLDALETLQDHLGELNDRVTGPQVLGRLGLAEPLPVHGPGAAKLLRKAEDAYEALVDVKRFWR